jgi:hypothetical protein
MEILQRLCSRRYCPANIQQLKYSAILLSLPCRTQLLTDWVKVKVTMRLTVSQSVSLGVEPHLGLMTRYLLLLDNYGLVCVGALSDERTGLSFVSQPAVLGQLLVCTIFTFYICHMLLNTYTIYTRPLSVRAHYSRLCPISGSFPITAV